MIAIDIWLLAAPPLCVCVRACPVGGGEEEEEEEEEEEVVIESNVMIGRLRYANEL